MKTDKNSKQVKTCRLCGCTEQRACVTETGPCSWAGPGICTACKEEPERIVGLTFAMLTGFNQLRQYKAFPKCKKWTLTDWACAMAGETGEACNLIKKLRRGEKIPPRNVGKELADIVIYADLLADKLGLSLAECVQQKFNEVSKRVNSPYKL